MIEKGDTSFTWWKFQCPINPDYNKYGLTPSPNCVPGLHIPVVYCHSPNGQCLVQQECLACNPDGTCKIPAPPFSPACDPYCRASCCCNCTDGKCHL